MSWRLNDLERKPAKIHQTKDILEHCERSIQNKDPFSLIRFGDAGLGILAAFLCPKGVDFGRKWGKSRNAKIIMNQLTVPEPKRIQILKVGKLVL